jgi:tRNA 2-selenouridine synthase
VNKLHNTIALADALQLTAPLFVDMRSPGEFATGHIPGAINVPLFSDEERAQVGTIYKQVSVDSAKERGLAIVSTKLPAIVNQIREYNQAGHPVIVYCWRGGMRSKSVVTVLELMGISAYQLLGGYKGYRHYVLDSLTNLVLQPEVVVLCGSTGVGKTTLLSMLTERNVPVIDLEHLANHRGSAFGQVGLGPSATAKNFDAQLLQELQRLNSQSYIVVECESRRIGNIFMPTGLYKAIRQGRRILVQADMETRISRLMAEYLDIYQRNHQAIINSIMALGSHLGKNKTQLLLTQFDTGNIRDVVRILLTDYYDPLYGYEEGNQAKFDLIVDANDLSAATVRIAEYLSQIGR